MIENTFVKSIEDPFITKDVPSMFQKQKLGGSLEGIKLAIKDILMVKGHKSSFGNPDWLSSHDVSQNTTESVQLLYEAGCQIVGFVHNDELLFGTYGANAHYGCPINYAAPDRFPGGSSSGSASAVSGGFVDLALGSDTGGSNRFPASFQGLYGIRPTTHRISNEYMIPFSQSMDTCGWFTRDPELLQRAGVVLLKKDPTARPQKEKPFKKIIVPLDVFEFCDKEVSDVVKEVVENHKSALEKEYTIEYKNVLSIEGVPEDLGTWILVFFNVAGYDLMQNHKEWFKQVQPRFGSMLKTLVDKTLQVTKEDHDKAQIVRSRIHDHFNDLIQLDTLMILPTTPCCPPKLDENFENLLNLTYKMASLATIASFSDLPHITMPAGFAPNGPVGISIIGGKAQDERLLQAAVTLTKTLQLK